MKLVLIVPLWNWNESESFKDPEDSGVLIVPLWNWNARTGKSYAVKEYVLIVPLWNWNLVVESSRDGIISSNHTQEKAINSSRNIRSWWYH